MIISTKAALALVNRYFLAKKKLLNSAYRWVIQATDDRLVTDVQVAIYNQAGNLVEQGAAELANNGIDWVYTT